MLPELPILLHKLTILSILILIFNLTNSTLFWSNICKVLCQSLLHMGSYNQTQYYRAPTWQKLNYGNAAIFQLQNYAFWNLSCLYFGFVSSKFGIWRQYIFFAKLSPSWLESNFASQKHSQFHILNMGAYKLNKMQE